MESVRSSIAQIMVHGYPEKGFSAHNLFSEHMFVRKSNINMTIAIRLS